MVDDAYPSHCLRPFIDFKKIKKLNLRSTPVEYGIYNGTELDTNGLRYMNRHFPRTLTHISLSYITLPDPEHFQLDRFELLSYLELHECRNTGEILAGYEEPRLKHFTFRYSDVYLEF
ncbi:hypothetical protein ABVK25_001509 [Lepraria finkii]|uniref:Uncharacterized protein n=1 Tax=Lepraria finkii TaxID=1340010 RepID=A0ABR4BJ94_9LECA